MTDGGLANLIRATYAALGLRTYYTSGALSARAVHASSCARTRFTELSRRGASCCRLNLTGGGGGGPNGVIPTNQ